MSFFNSLMRRSQSQPPSPRRSAIATAAPSATVSGVGQRQTGQPSKPTPEELDATIQVADNLKSAAHREQLRQTQDVVYHHLLDQVRKTGEYSADAVKGKQTVSNVQEEINEAENLLDHLITLQNEIDDIVTEAASPDEGFLTHVLETYNENMGRIKDNLALAERRIDRQKTPQKTPSMTKKDTKAADMKKLSSELRRARKAERNVMDWTDEEESFAPLDGDAKAHIHGDQKVRDSLYPNVTVRRKRHDGLSLPGVSFPTSTPRVATAQPDKTPSYARRLTKEDVLDKIWNDANDATQRDNQDRNSQRRRGRPPNKGGPSDDVSPQDSVSNTGSSSSHSHPHRPPRKPPHRGDPPDSDPSDDSSEQSSQPPHRDSTSELLTALTKAMTQGLNQGYDVKSHMTINFTGHEHNTANAYLNWAEAWQREEKKLLSFGFTKAECFAEMRKTLSKSALGQIENMQINDENYDNAQKALFDVYNNVQSLVRTMIYDLVDMRAITDNASLNTLRSFFSTFNGVRQRFSQLKISDADLATLFFIASFERKLPDSMMEAWRKKVQKFDKEHSKPGCFVQLPLESFVQHVLDVIKLRTIHGESRQQKQQVDDKRSKGKETRFSAPPQTAPTRRHVEHLIYATDRVAKNLPCNTCDTDKPHLLHQCMKVKTMTTDERWDAVKKKGVCPGCQKHLSEVNHPEGNCDVVKCEATGCARGHHPFFHPEPSTSSGRPWNRGSTWNYGGRGRGTRGRGGYYNGGRYNWRGYPPRGGHRGGYYRGGADNYSSPSEEASDKKSGPNVLTTTSAEAVTSAYTTTSER